MAAQPFPPATCAFTCFFGLIGFYGLPCLCRSSTFVLTFASLAFSSFRFYAVHRQRQRGLEHLKTRKSEKLQDALSQAQEALAAETLSCLSASLLQLRLAALIDRWTSRQRLQHAVPVQHLLQPCLQHLLQHLLQHCCNTCNALLIVDRLSYACNVGPRIKCVCCNKCITWCNTSCNTCNTSTCNTACW